MNTAEPSQQGGKPGRAHSTKTGEQQRAPQGEQNTDISELADRARNKLERSTSKPLNKTELAEEPKSRSAKATNPSRHMPALAEQAKNQLAQLTGQKPVTVIGAIMEEKGWRVMLEVLEMSRIPPSTDIMGEYHMLLDDDGNLLSFERKRTYQRGQPIEG